VIGCVHAAFQGDHDALQAALDAAGGGPHTHALADVVGLVAALDAKQPLGDYQPFGSYAPAAHDHDNRYYTDFEVDALLAAKQVAGAYAAAVHGHAIADVVGLVAALAAKQDAGSFQPLDSDLTALAALATTTFGRSFLELADAAAARALLGLGSAALQPSSAFQAAGSYQPLDSDLTAIAALTTTSYGRALLGLADQAALTALLAAATGSLQGAMSAQDKTRLDALATPYRTLLDSSGSHIAARVAGTYGFGQGDPLAISATGTLYPLNIIQISAADYPAIGSLTAKLRVKATVNCNDVAPGHNFVLGLHPVTRPATSGGAGLAIYTIGAAVAGSTVTATTPAADSSAAFTSADFALPADGQYVLGAVTNGTTATSAHVHLSAALQLHHS
jgi:hypothetical protein